VAGGDQRRHDGPGARPGDVHPLGDLDPRVFLELEESADEPEPFDASALEDTVGFVLLRASTAMFPPPLSPVKPD